MALLHRLIPLPILVAAFVLALPACSNSSDSSSNFSRELDCEREVYPCTLGEVPATVLARSEELGRDAYTRIAAGEPIADVESWLRTQADMAAVESSDVALWFRLEDGRPHWVLSDAAFSETPGTDAPGVAGSHQRPQRGQSTEAKRVPKEVVGITPEEKQALVLAPYLWEFKQWDDGPLVADLLEGARGYEGNVVFKANATALDQVVSIADLQNWDAFDVVHVSSHGTQICGSDACRTLLLYGKVFAGGSLPDLGAIVGASLVSGTPAGTSEGVEADFFRAQYPSGLEKTIVYLSSCRSSQNADFPGLFSNPSSVFLGWSDTTGTGTASNAALLFYQELIDNGRTTKKALSEVVQANLNVYSVNGATLRRFQGGDDLRIREIITAYAPGAVPSPATELKDGDPIPFLVGGDQGALDSMDFNVQIEGVEEDDDLNDFVLHISVNGTEAKQTWTLEAAVQVDTYAYRLEDVADFGVDFGNLGLYDVQFWVDLPEGGESRLPLELTPAKWTMRFSGPYLAGTYAGSNAELALRNAFGIGSILIFETGDVDQEPEVRINTTWLAPIMSGENVFELRAPPAPAGPDDLEGTAISVITFRDVVDDGMGTVADSGVVNGDGVTTVIQPDDSIYTSPSPPTLTLFDYDPNAPTVRGTIEGPYGVCYGFIDLGPQGFCDTYDVSIDFSAVQEIAGP